MSSLMGSGGELKAVVTVTRKNGTTENIVLIGKITPEQQEQIMEAANGGNTLDGSKERGD